jgi:cell division protein FtsZ
VLFNVSGGANIGIHEVQEAANIINDASDEDAFVIWGHVFDPEMEDAVKITVIATGFDEDPSSKTQDTSSSRTFAKPVKMSMADTSVATQGGAQLTAPTSSMKSRPEMGETDVKVASPQQQGQSSEPEDLFRTSGVPVNQLDIPSFLRKKR